VRILVVEDEPRLGRALQRGLTAEGYLVDLAIDGIAGLDAARNESYDVVILDIMLPQLSGYRVVRALREENNWVPVLMLSAKDGEYDQADGLDCGADDYLTKPFSMRELAARVHALLRRVDRGSRAPSSDGRSEPPIVVGDLEINRAERRVSRAGVEAHLTPTEFDLLVHLARRPRAVLPRERLLADVWGWADATGTRTVDSHVKALRRKLGADLIRTVHGVGYALDGPSR